MGFNRNEDLERSLTEMGVWMGIHRGEILDGVNGNGKKLRIEKYRPKKNKEQSIIGCKDIKKIQKKVENIKWRDPTPSRCSEISISLVFKLIYSLKEP